MFTDIHSHILPQVDDGCSSLEESIALLESAIDNDVKSIIITPHFNCENSPIKKNELLKKINELKGKVREKKLDIDIYPGTEVRLSRRIPEFANDKKYITTLAGSSKYMLIELPFSHEPYKLSEILFEIKLLKIIPVLSHPERYGYLSGKLRYLQKLHDEGMLMQVNNSSLLKGWTSPVYRRAVSMLRAGIIDFIGSDCHHMKGRFSNFRPAYKKLIKILDKESADTIAIKNPARVLENQDILA